MVQVKIGIAGLGALGELHIKNICEHVPEAKVTAVCDIRQDRVNEICGRYDIRSGYTKFEDLVADGEVEAVMIVTNVTAHKDQCILAAQAGKHIFCEKPLAKTVEECHAIEEAVEKNKGKIFTIGYMRRSDPAYAAAMERVRSGAIGDVFMYRGISLDPASVLPHHIEGVRAGRYAPFFYEMGIHDADLALWFLDGDIESVSSVGGAYVEKELARYQDYDNAVSIGRFKNGSIFSIQVGRSHNSSHVQAEIIGTKGTIRINNIPNVSRLEFFDSDGYRQPLEQTFLDRWGDAYVCEVRNWAGRILGKDTPVVRVRDGARSLRIADMMQKAFVEKRTVYVGEMTE
jgi:myo-inositol 2-dehydrogenase/D-chiro-inositol 1-dehydrogenase